MGLPAELRMFVVQLAGPLARVSQEFVSSSLRSTERRLEEREWSLGRVSSVPVSCRQLDATRETRARILQLEYESASLNLWTEPFNRARVVITEHDKDRERVVVA